MKKAKVKFLPQDIELEIDPDESVMELAHRNNIFIKSVCNGLPSCAECRVKLVEGDHNVMRPFNKELGLIGTGHFVDQRRLSCQLHCYGDITVDLTEQIEKEQAGPRRPQGSQKNETEESFAVAGNMLEQEQQAMSELAAGAIEAKDTDVNSGKDFYKELYKETNEKSSAGKGGHNRNKTRNRQRNRNRNRNRGVTAEKASGSSTDNNSKNRNRRPGRYRPKSD